MNISKFRFKVYVGHGVSRYALELIRWQCELINAGRVYLPRKRGYKYALYMHGKNPLIDHSYKEEISIDFKPSEFERVEVFVSEFDVKCRAVAYQGNPRVEIIENCFLNYEHTRRGSKDLVVYFDYSRLVAKVNIHEEFIPKFNLRTHKDVLVLGNQFGFWGTSLLFSDDGRFIYDGVVNYLNTIIENNSYSKLYFVGGSQGATAALAYGQAFNQISAIYAACPVDVNKKNMLKHLAEKVDEEDVNAARAYLNKTLKRKNVFLYSTKIDSHHDFHNYLAQHVSRENYSVCHDPLVDHGGCLRYYIKNIYNQIENG